MSETVHVFIASTKGLIPIVHLNKRLGANSVSLVTIDGGAKLASFISEYRDFVSQDYTPLPAYFPENAYHLIVGENIDQGESWQLAVAIAHLLYNESRLGDGKVRAGERVIVATGKIEARDARVTLVSHLAQKCISAQSQIRQWQEMHCKLDFLVPKENFRQPLPDIQWQLRPVQNMQEVESALHEQGLIQRQEIIEPVASSRTELLRKSSEIFTQLVSNFSKRALEGAAISFVVLSLIAYFLLFVSGSDAAKLSYKVKAAGQCGLTEPVVIEYPGASIIQMADLELKEVCELSVHLTSKDETLWLISDSYALLVLKASQDNDSIWPIPVPSWQEASRSYTLMRFSDDIDESYEQSMSDYLSTLHEQNQPVQLEALSIWLNQQELDARFIQQRLIFEKKF